MRYRLHFVLILAITLLFSVSVFTQQKTEKNNKSKGHIGLQLYSLRNQFSKDVNSSLDTVHNFGIQYVELAGTYNIPPAKFKEDLKTKGLEAKSGHFPYEKFRDNPEEIATVAKELGLEYAGCAWIPHKGDVFDEATARQAIEVFNKAGEALAKHGIKFFYHNHGYEFQPYKDGTLLDLIMAETKPDLVSFEMDVYWIVHPGQDPVKLLNKYKGRWKLMHVKDMKKGNPTGKLTGHDDPNNNVVVGTGQMDWPAIIKAAQGGGVKWFFIEDESNVSVDQIPQSVKYLTPFF